MINVMHFITIKKKRGPDVLTSHHCKCIPEITQKEKTLVHLLGSEVSVVAAWPCCVWARGEPLGCRGEGQREEARRG